MRHEVLRFERIRNLRLDRNLSQQQIAELLDVKQNEEGGYAFSNAATGQWLKLDGSMTADMAADYEKAREFTAIHAFLLGLRTGRGLPRA